MLDSFEILSTSGVVLWSKQYAPIGANVVNSLIRDIFIEERSGAAAEDSSQKPTYSKEGYTLKWTTAKDLGLIFVAVYQSLIHLSWVDKLLDNVRTLFSELYRDDLKKRNTTSFRCNFDPYFDRQVQELEKNEGGSITAAQSSTSNSVAELTPPSTSSGADEPPPIPTLRISENRPALERAQSAESTPIATPDTSRPASPAVSHLLTAKQRHGSRRSRKAANTVVNNSAPASSGDESSASVRKDKIKTKKARKWDASGIADEEDDTVLDYSQAGNAQKDLGSSTALEGVTQASMGTRTGKGEFVLKDLDDEIDNIMAASTAKKAAAAESTGSSGLVNSGIGVISGLFRNVVGGKTLTKEDLAKPLKGMEDHLLKKNVAREAAVRLCESVEQDLVGKKTESFTGTIAVRSNPFLR